MTFSRDPAAPGSQQFVLSVNGNSNIYFDTNYGGAPLRWNYPYPSGGRQEIITVIRDTATPPNIYPYPGKGFQWVSEEGQDLTQASANGLTQRKIARTGVDTGMELWRRNYYCRESTSGWPTVTNGPYIIQGFFPDFWASLGDADGPTDDSIPCNSFGLGHLQFNKSDPSDPYGAGWVTGYTSPNTVGVAPYNVNNWGTPVYFSPYVDSAAPGGPQTVYSGILMEGNERESISRTFPPASPPYTDNWAQRLRSIPHGRVAFRIKVSLKWASDDAYGGILFRKNVSSTAATMDDVWAAQGYMLLVYRSGLITLTYTNASGVQSFPWSYGPTTATTNAVQNDYGINLEIRTFNGSPELLQPWADDQSLILDQYGNPGYITLGGSDTYAAAEAQHIGLIAYTTNSAPTRAQPNFVRFGDREVFNVGTETTMTYEPQGDGSIIITGKIGPAILGIEKRRLYSATQVAFCDPVQPPVGKFENMWTETPKNTILKSKTGAAIQYNGEIVAGTAPINDLIFVGWNSGAFGLCCVPTSVSISGGTTTPGHTDMIVQPVSTGDPLLHVNALPNYTAYAASAPWYMDSIEFKQRWYPFKVT